MGTVHQVRTGIVCSLVFMAGFEAIAAPTFYGIRGSLGAVGVSDSGVVLLNRVNMPAALWQNGSVGPTLDLFGPVRISANGLVAIGNGPGGATRLSIGGTWIPVPNPPGTQVVFPPVVALSANGNVIAGNSDVGAWYWSAVTQNSTVIPTSSGFQSAQDVSPDGTRIIGRSGFGSFVHTIGGQTLLPVPIPGWQITEFRRYSRDGGSIVGSAYTGGSTLQSGVAFRWTEAEGYSQLPALANVTTNPIQTMFANAASSNAELIAGGKGGLAWIWSQATGSRYLKDWLAQQGVSNLDNWTLLSVTDVSADGRYLTGLANYFTGTGMERAAFVVEIPSPTTGGGLVVAGLVISVRRRRR